MANTAITKRALATALKELMQSKSFEKITISDICDKCSMNRKSFYYHFRDKYELLNWIFHSEFISVGGMSKLSDEQIFKQLCCYLYENRDFYRKAFRVEGTNCFRDYFHKIISSMVSTSLKIHLETQNIDEFSMNFFSDGFTCVIERWILEVHCLPPEKFIEKIFNLINTIAAKIHNRQLLT